MIHRKVRCSPNGYRCFSQGLLSRIKIAGYIHEQGKGCILVINKWDLVEKDDKTLHKFEKQIRSELLFMQYAPIILVSALTKQRVPKY